ncbi:MAG: YbaB/EbfC family nucleoid-associated protein [Proteobacteria bacterium]|nr:YbaB/EbfC family nucleoid-associated protein [Pseudomonadota bacterium]
MKDMASMMRQAQQMKKDMATMQAKLDELTMDGTAAGGKVTVTMSGKMLVRGVKIDTALVDADDVETLEDLIAAATNDALTKVQDYVNGEVQKITGGLGGGLLG